MIVVEWEFRMEVVIFPLGKSFGSMTLKLSLLGWGVVWAI